MEASDCSKSWSILIKGLPNEPVFSHLLYAQRTKHYRVHTSYPIKIRAFLPPLKRKSSRRDTCWTSSNQIHLHIVYGLPRIIERAPYNPILPLQFPAAPPLLEFAP